MVEHLGNGIVIIFYIRLSIRLHFKLSRGNEQYNLAISYKDKSHEMLPLYNTNQDEDL